MILLAITAKKRWLFLSGMRCPPGAEFFEISVLLSAFIPAKSRFLLIFAVFIDIIYQYKRCGGINEGETR